VYSELQAALGRRSLAPSVGSARAPLPSFEDSTPDRRLGPTQPTLPSRARESPSSKRKETESVLAREKKERDDAPPTTPTPPLTPQHTQLQPTNPTTTKQEDLVANEVVTAPYDPRFPSTNQSRHCFVRYNEYHKCLFERGQDDQRCAFYKRAADSLCPADWVEEWDTLRQEGKWFGKY